MSTEVTIQEPSEIAHQREMGKAAGSLLEIVMQAASDPAIDPARLEKFLQIGRELEADKAKREYIAAFEAAKVELSGIKITKRGAIVYEAKPGKSGSRIPFVLYDDLAKTLRPVLAAHNLTATYSYEYLQNPPKAVCVMVLTHGAGHREEFRSIPLPMIDQSGGKTDIQGAGSISSYGRRYVTTAAFDIVAEGEDDDGSGKSTEPISDKQVTIIVKLIEAAKCGEASFLKYMKVDCIADIIVKDYLKATTALHNKLGEAV